MARMTITTGIRVDRSMGFTIDDDTISIEAPDFAERVFVASNRISGIADDIIALDTDWQRNVRRLLDSYGMASMTVGDTIEVALDGGLTILRWTCDTSGWTVDRYDAIKRAPRH